MTILLTTQCVQLLTLLWGCFQTVTHVLCISIPTTQPWDVNNEFYSNPKVIHFKLSTSCRISRTNLDVLDGRGGCCFSVSATQLWEEETGKCMKWIPSYTENGNWNEQLTGKQEINRDSTKQRGDFLTSYNSGALYYSYTTLKMNSLSQAIPACQLLHVTTRGQSLIFALRHTGGLTIYSFTTRHIQYI